MKPLTGVARNMARTLSRCGGVSAQGSRRKPRPAGGLDQSVDALLLRHRDALFPLLARLWRRLARRVADNDAIEPIRGAFGAPQRGGAAHRQARNVRLGDAERV